MLWVFLSRASAAIYLIQEVGVSRIRFFVNGRCLVVIAFYFLSACSPIYNNVVDLTPPKTEAGLACIAECEKSQRSCLLVENKNYMNCRSSEFFYRRLFYAHPRSLYHYSHRYYYAPFKHYNNRRLGDFCTVNRQQCKQDYLACYGACGGAVESHKECAVFCDP